MFLGISNQTACTMASSSITAVNWDETSDLYGKPLSPLSLDARTL